MIPEAGCESTKKTKHFDLHKAIEEIDKISKSLNSLFIEITEAEVPSKELSTVVKCPSLQSILIEGPDRIRKKIEECLKKIDEIKNTIF